MHNVHDAEPALFRTRFTLSYLRGPLTRDQLGRLAAEQPAPERDQDGAARAFAATPAAAPAPAPAPPAGPAPAPFHAPTPAPSASESIESAPATVPGAMLVTEAAAATVKGAAAAARVPATSAGPLPVLSSAAKATTLRSVAQPPLTPDALAATAPQAKPVRAAAARPALPTDVEELFLASPFEGRLIQYRPALLARVALHYVHNHADLDAWLEPTLLCPLPRGRGQVAWAEATWTQWEKLHTLPQPANDAQFVPPATSRVTSKGFSSLQRSLGSHLARQETMPVWYCRPLKLWSGYGESRAEFAARAQHAAREKRDREMEKLRTKYAPKLTRLRERIRKSEHRSSRQQAESTQQKYQTAITVGATALGAIFGRRSVISGAASTARGVGRVAMERGDVRRAQEDVVVHKQRLLELEQKLEESLAAIAERPTEAPIEQKDVRPRKGDIEVLRCGLLWMPWRIDRSPDGEPGWTS